MKPVISPASVFPDGLAFAVAIEQKAKGYIRAMQSQDGILRFYAHQIRPGVPASAADKELRLGRFDSMEDAVKAIVEAPVIKSNVTPFPVH